MAKPIMLLTAIPFEGFYHSIWSSEIDSQEENHCENEGTAQSANRLNPTKVNFLAAGRDAIKNSLSAGRGKLC